MLRLALMGGSSRIATEYAQAVTRLRDVSFVAVVDEDDRRRGELAEILGVPNAAPSLDCLLETRAASCDAVLIYSSIGERVSEVRRAAMAGLHLLVDSSLASSTADADQIISTCQTAGVKLMVGSLARFRPSIAAIKQTLDRGNLGRPALFRSHAWSPRGEGLDRGSPIVCQLDLAHWMFGGLPTDIFAQGRTTTTETSTWPDYLQIHLGFPDGGMALISIATSLPPGASYESISLIGSTGAAYSDDQYQTQLVFRGGPPIAPKTTEGITAVTAQLREFAAAIAQDRDPAVGGAGGRASLLLSAAVVQSLASQQPVRIRGGKYESIA